MLNKVAFQFQLDSVIDLITNSSSELFIFIQENKTILMELLDSLHPNWRNEYEEPKHISDLTADELETYFSYKYSEPFIKYDTQEEYWQNVFKERVINKEEYFVPLGFEFDELWELHTDEWGTKYRLKNNNSDSENSWNYSFVTEENKGSIIKKLCTDESMKKSFFMFSFGENPEWEYQEKFEEVGERLHLG